MNKYNVELVFRGLDPRIQDKLHKLYEDGELAYYIEKIVISEEISILEDNIKREYEHEFKKINRKLESIEDRINTLETRKYIDNKEEIEESVEGDIPEFEDTALDFLNNLMSI